MLKSLKTKLMKFSEIFKNENDFNEKNIVGFMSFAVMVMFAIVDLVMPGKDLMINETVFNSFVIVTLGSFGIDGITQIFKSKDNTPPKL